MINPKLKIYCNVFEIPIDELLQLRYLPFEEVARTPFSPLRNNHLQARQAYD